MLFSSPAMLRLSFAQCSLVVRSGLRQEDVLIAGKSGYFIGLIYIRDEFEYDNLIKS